MRIKKNINNLPGKRALSLLHLLIILAVGLVPASTVFSQVPTTVSYQGRLTTPAGAPVSDGTYSVTFRIYDDATAGNLFWEEIKSVITKSGLFSVQLGQTNPLDQGTLSIPNLFLAVKIGAGAELTPRRPLAAVPYATMVSTVDGASGGMIIGDVYATGQVSGSSTSGSGGFFQSTSTTANTHGVIGRYSSAALVDGSGVYGYAKPADNYGIGGEFEGGELGVKGTVFAAGSDNSAYLGIVGSAISVVPQRFVRLYGVYGTAHSAGENYGVFGEASGSATTGQCVFYGLYGSANGVGPTAGNYGVYAKATGGGNNYGIYAQGSTYAGFFSGDVTVHNLSKFGGSFKIDHPLDPANKYLQHSFVESPDMMNIYNDNITLDADGAATITMPDWFDALNRDFRYQLTAMGAPGPNLYVSQEVNNNHFSIAGGTAGMKVSWQVTGVRKDVWAEAHRIQVEVPKDPNKVGTYLTPELFGKPETMNETYEMTKRAEEMTKQKEQDRERLEAKNPAEVPKK